MTARLNEAKTSTTFDGSYDGEHRLGSEGEDSYRLAI